MKKMSIYTGIATILVLGGLTVGACSPRIDTRGNLPEDEMLAELRVGEYTREDVMDILGSPSATSEFGNQTWYYISKRTETTAFWAPEVKDRKVIVVRFDDKGRVAAIDKVGLEEGNFVETVDRETPTAGHELTVFEQLFGQIGRFSK
ncbi:Putative small membrane lipoprotein [Magnetospira sp. QH-2]|nr:Putative small membrane lipoprotein [Magnetospira sp. QH-2]